MLVMYLKAPEDFNIQNPLAFNAGALVASDSPQWLKGLGGSFDLFSFWIMGLMAIGVGAASRKMTFGKAFATILFPWALYVLMKTGSRHCADSSVDLDNIWLDLRYALRTMRKNPVARIDPAGALRVG